MPAIVGEQKLSKQQTLPPNSIESRSSSQKVFSHEDLNNAQAGFASAQVVKEKDLDPLILSAEPAADLNVKTEQNEPASMAPDQLNQPDEDVTKKSTQTPSVFNRTPEKIDPLAVSETIGYKSAYAKEPQGQ